MVLGLKGLKNDNTAIKSDFMQFLRRLLGTTKREATTVALAQTFLAVCNVMYPRDTPSLRFLRVLN
jgi:hypothetical protein